MEETPTAQKAKSLSIDTHHIDVLDGVRAFAVLIVVWFHVWQQSWLMPYFELPFLARLGFKATGFSLDFIPRTGYLFVDCLLFLSAFCLFLPHARARLCGEKVPRVREFYRKRVARIVPSYYFCVLLILFAFAIPTGKYANSVECLCDLLPMLTFTQTFFPRVYLATQTNGVLWTAAIEMQFYLIFPLLAACFRKRPLMTYLCMVGVSMLYLQGILRFDPDSLRTTLNQLPAFFGVFANGMAAAFFYVWLAQKTKRSAWLSLLSLAALLFSVWLLYGMQHDASRVSPAQLWQAAYRYRLSIVFALLSLSSALTFAPIRVVFANPLSRFLAAISYNLYIWHQWLAVRLKEWRIPFWPGDTAPNLTGDRVWQWKYTFLVLGVSFLAAALVTYLLERPMARLILHRERAIKINGGNYEDQL